METAFPIVDLARAQKPARYIQRSAAKPQPKPDGGQKRNSFGCGLAALRCIAGFQTRQPHAVARTADLEIGDTAGLETCATTRGCLAAKFAQPAKIFVDSKTLEPSADSGGAAYFPSE